MSVYPELRRSVALACLCLAGMPLRAQPTAGLQAARLLAEAREPVRIVCFGDSITGVYYHSGGRRAWPEMLKLALNRLFPKADVTVFNAGVSGNTSTQGLARMQADVLDRTPHLVVIMFGMNDLAYGAVTSEQDAAKKVAFVNNLKTMVGRCRDAGAETILCTQNPVYPEAAPDRPPERVGEFAELIRQTGVELQIPVVDVYAEWQTLKATDARSWRLLMSETIHPSMAGHKRMAEKVASALSGTAVSLADVAPQQPVCGSLLARLRGGLPVKLMVPASLADSVRAMVRRRFPAADVTVATLPEQAASLEALAAAHNVIRNHNPHAVFVSMLPGFLNISNEETFVRQASWLVNYALPFAGSAWTAVGLDPALANPGLTLLQQEGVVLLRETVRGHDLDWIAQTSGTYRSLQAALDAWFDAQLDPPPAAGPQSASVSEVPVRTLELPPGSGNPRNSEGAFVTLKDGRILFVYTHYTAGAGGDHDPACLAARISSDDGRTWTSEDRLVVSNEGGMNVMSVSLLRLQSGAIALFYLRKNNEQDCRPVLRLSTDEGATWGAPVTCIVDEVGYYVMNNDRAVQLTGGRLILPVSLHWPQGAAAADWQGTLMCYLSDDNGVTWRRSATAQKGYDAAGVRITTQEPGVVELKDGRVMMFIRASGGCQYLAYSSDGGDTWTPPVASAIRSPVSPASIKRLPSTGDLLLVWNDHAAIPASLSARRVPLSTALSKDDGKTWRNIKVLEGNPQGWYCYIALHPVDNAVLLGYCAMSALAHSRVTRVPVPWLYAGKPAMISINRPPVADLFESASAGPFTRLETRLGVWGAGDGHAEVYSYARGKGIRLQGGTDRTVTLTLPQAAASGMLSSFGVERFTSAAPYALVVEVLAETGWQTVCEQGPDTPAGQPGRLKVLAQGLRASQFRFRCTSALGAIIVPGINLHGYFND